MSLIYLSPKRILGPGLITSMMTGTVNWNNSILLPSVPALGDLVVVSYASNQENMSAPRGGGWTIIKSQNSSWLLTSIVAYKFQDGSIGSTISFSQNGIVGVCNVFHGVSTSNPFGPVRSYIGTGYGSASAIYTAGQNSYGVGLPFAAFLACTTSDVSTPPGCTHTVVANSSWPLLVSTSVGTALTASSISSSNGVQSTFSYVGFFLNPV